MDENDKKAIDELKGTVHELAANVTKMHEGAVDRETVENIVVDLLEKQTQAHEAGAGRRSFEPGDEGAALNAIGKTGPALLEALHSNRAKAIAPLVRKSSDEVEHLQRAGDQLLIVSAILSAKTGKPVDPRETSFYGETFVPAMRAAVDTATAGEGAEWVPKELSPNLIDRVELDMRVMSLFGSMDMPTQPYEIPGRAVARQRLAQGAEATADTGQTAVKKVTPGSRKVTLTAKKFWGEALVSKEAEEDAIVAQLPLLESELVRYMRFDLEDTGINGDTAAAQDTQGGFYAADSPLRNWNGLRKLALAAAKTDFANAKLTVTGLRTNRKKMGKYGVDPFELAHVLSINAYIDLLDDASVLTLEKYGPNATILTGELGKVDNIPLIVSEAVYTNLNATGIVDGVTTDRTEALTVYRPGFAVGERRGLTIEILRELYSEFDQDAVKVSLRRAFEPLQPAATEKIVSVLFNVKT